MSIQRVLIIEEDRLLANFYREHLENGGLFVESARSGEAALRAMEERRPDVVVIDPLTPHPEAADVISHIRQNPATQGMPVIALPTSRVALAEAAQHSGANKVLPRTINTPAELTDAIQVALGQERTAVVSKSLPFTADEAWLRTSIQAAPDVVISMRHALQSAVQDGGGAKGMRSLFQVVHGFTEQMALFGERPLYQFATAIEALVFDLHRFPEHANASTLRTVSQAIDFLGVLLTGSHREQLHDHKSAQVLVVDDEDGARKMMMAALNLVNVNAMSADTPAAALAALATEAFDLVFLDVGLPEMTGFDLCARMRALPLHEKTPIVFITGMATFQNRVQSSLSGGNDFVGKPFSLPELGLKALIWILKGQLRLL
jgi:CheY-like chemotaxis protein